MSKKTRFVFAAYLIALTALLIGIWLATPSSDSKEILGLVIRSNVDGSQNVFIPNRWIRCVPERWDQASESTCTIELFGETLKIVAARNPLSNPNQLGGNCTALYDGKKQTCTLSTYRGELWWVANIYMGNQISEAQQRVLKRRHILGNLPQDVYFYGAFAISLLNALVLAIVTYFGQLQTVSTPPKLAYMLSFMVTSAVIGLVGGLLLYILCMALTHPFG